MTSRPWAGAAPASGASSANPTRKSSIPMDVDVFDPTERLTRRSGGMSLFSMRGSLALKQSTRWNAHMASGDAAGIKGLRRTQPPRYPVAQITSPNRRFLRIADPTGRASRDSKSLAAANAMSFPAGQAPVSGPRRLIPRLTCRRTRVRRRLVPPPTATALATRLTGNKQIVFVLQAASPSQ